MQPFYRNFRLKLYLAKAKFFFRYQKVIFVKLENVFIWNNGIPNQPDALIYHYASRSSAYL